MSQLCPCQSGLPYAACCAPYHQGEAAPTPVALMRSRYSAFALALGDYLVATGTVGSSAEELAAWSRSVVWLSLVVHEHDAEHFVRFTARYLEGKSLVTLSERSEFERRGGRWHYVRGEPNVQTRAIERNEPCPCASGKKFKACHG